MFAPVLTALVCVGLAASGTLRLSDAARVYARRSRIADGSELDLENAPRLEASLAWPTWRLALDYVPRLTWVDVLGSEPSPTLLLQSGVLEFSLRQPRYTLSVVQAGAFGDQDFSQGATPALPSAVPVPTIPGEMKPPDLNLLPHHQVLSVAAAETSADFQYAWSRRWRSTLQAALGFSGGADVEAQQFLPRQRTVRLDAGLVFRRSLVDDLGTVLGGEQIETSNGYSHRVASVVENWSLRWSANSGSEVGLGGALQESTTPDGASSIDWVPVGSATITHAWLRREMRTRFQWGLAYGPELNVLLGTLQSRLSATAQAALTVRHTSLSLTLGAAQTLPTDAPNAARLLTAAIALDHQLLTWLFVQLGGQVTGQHFVGNNFAESPGSIWVLYTGLEGRAPEVRF